MIGKISIYKHNENYSTPDLNYDKLQLIDLRTAEVKKDDYKNLCDESNIPLPQYKDYWDDDSAENTPIHSDWEGPTGEVWLDK